MTQQVSQDTQACTQAREDPRRLGRNNSGLSEQDVSDVICILHPSSQAAFKIVAHTAQRNPQHILQNQGLNFFSSSQVSQSEAETMLARSVAADRPQDLALRFSSNVCDPANGFCFGRNLYKCDINLDPQGNQRRVSNTHFRIFYNDNGILMLEDCSTNGTVVDTQTLGGRKPSRPSNERAMMLQAGSIIEILSQNQEDTIKFIVRIPPRDGYISEFQARYRAFMKHKEIAQERAIAAQQGPPMTEAAARGHLAAPLAGPPNAKQMPAPPPTTASSNFGMHWDGGGKYNCVAQLGRGAFAVVYQIATTYGGEYFAAKELEKKRFMKNGILDTRIDNEMQIMQGLRHDNIVQYIDFVETPSHLYIVMEYVPGGDLQGYMQSHGTLQEDLAREMTRQILSALHYLHQKNITHRDIKPDNILICTEHPFVVKLTDFGLSKVVKNSETFLKTFCGTLLYCAPEVFPFYSEHMAKRHTKRTRNRTEDRSYSQLVDIWSYAAVLWTSLCGKPPFEGVVDANGKGMFEQIMAKSIDTTPLSEHGVSADAIDLLSWMLNTDAAARPSEMDCLRHPWLNDGQWLPDHERSDRLAAIEEHHDEEDLGASNLSIHDRQAQLGNGPLPKIGLNTSGDSEQGRDLKRVKGDSYLDTGEPKGDLLFESIPIMHDAKDGATNPSPSKPPKLFGEISQPALGSSGALDHQLGLHMHGQTQQLAANNSWGMESMGSDGSADSRILDLENSSVFAKQPEGDAVQQQQQGPKANTSLSGAESMVRELHMASPKAGNSAVNTPKGPRTPNGSYDSNGNAAHSRSSSKNGSVDITPKPNAFKRRIRIEETASFYYDPYDPSTHNVEYASKVSGRNFLSDGSAANLGEKSLPPTEAGSNLTDARSEDKTLMNRTNGQVPSHNDDQDQEEGQAVSGPMEDKENADQGQQAENKAAEPTFLKPAPRLARLVSTTDSFASITLPLTKRVTTWGRLAGADLHYPNPNESRVPRLGLELVFHGPDLARAEEERRDWMHMPGLWLSVRTRATVGIHVNGVLLKEKDADGRSLYGKLQNGDVIEICPSKGEEKGLKFVVEIFVDSARNRRPDGEPFKVLVDA